MIKASGMGVTDGTQAKRMNAMSELPDEIYTDIQSLCAAGDEHVDAAQYAEALRSYQAAWSMLPEPKTDWEAATWILAAMGDACFLSGDFAGGRDHLSTAMQCPGGIGNPFLHLRLGQCQLELEAFDRATDELMRAYMGAGPDIFRDDDPKYIRFLQSKAANIQAPKLDS
jgi:hypothetical protein